MNEIRLLKLALEEVEREADSGDDRTLEGALEALKRVLERAIEKQNKRH
jgi:hypothetical protein